MGLADARALDGGVLPPLSGAGPFSAAALQAWSGASFWMPPTDPMLEAVFHGEPVSGHPALDNLVGIGRYWEEHPDWMEFLDPSSPAYHAKQVERALYVGLWGDHLRGARRVLDLGGGVGRFAVWLMAQGCAVELVDPDLRSLWRAVRSAGQVGAGALDAHWGTGECLPEIAPVDVVLAVEVLCYAADPAAVVAQAAGVLPPGGRLLCSVEADLGWAMATDAAPGSVEALFRDDGVVHVPGDRWVQTYSEARLRDLLSTHFMVEEVVPTHYALSGPFEQAAGPLHVDEALALEARLAANPRTRGLHRAWAAVAKKR